MAAIEAAVLQPISELLPEGAFPFDLFTSEGGPGGILERIFVLDHVTTQTPFGTLFSATAAVEGELEVGLPGCQAVSLVLGAGVPDFTVAGVRLLLGPDWSLEIDRVALAL